MTRIRLPQLRIRRVLSGGSGFSLGLDLTSLRLIDLRSGTPLIKVAGSWTYTLYRVLLIYGVLLWALSFQTRTPGCTWTPSSGEPLSPHGPWSACLQPSPCDLTCDSALAFLVLAGLLSGSMGLPIKYPPISRALRQDKVKVSIKGY